MYTHYRIYNITHEHCVSGNLHVRPCRFLSNFSPVRTNFERRRVLDTNNNIMRTNTKLCTHLTRLHIIKIKNYDGCKISTVK